MKCPQFKRVKVGEMDCLSIKHVQLGINNDWDIGLIPSNEQDVWLKNLHDKELACNLA